MSLGKICISFFLAIVSILCLSAFIAVSLEFWSFDD